MGRDEVPRVPRADRNPAASPPHDRPADACCKGASAGRAHSDSCAVGALDRAVAGEGRPLSPGLDGRAFLPEVEAALETFAVNRGKPISEMSGSQVDDVREELVELFRVAGFPAYQTAMNGKLPAWHGASHFDELLAVESEVVVALGGRNRVGASGPMVVAGSVLTTLRDLGYKVSRVMRPNPDAFPFHPMNYSDPDG